MAKDRKRKSESPEETARENQDHAEEELPGPAVPVRSPDPDRAPEVAREINSLTTRIVAQAEKLRVQLQDSEIQRSLRELRDASVLFQSIADSAAQGMIRGALPTAHLTSLPIEASVVTQPNGRDPRPTAQGDCGCGSKDCGEACKPKCCIQLYMSRVWVIDGQGLEGKLELIVAVQAGDTWGLAPGLTGFLSVPKGTGGAKLNDPIANFCVPCDGCMTVPIHAEALEVSKGGWFDAITEGRLEKGSAFGAMTLRCDCDVAPVSIAIGLTVNQEVKGVVGVEVSAKRKPGGCC